MSPFRPTLLSLALALAAQAPAWAGPVRVEGVLTSTKAPADLPQVLSKSSEPTPLNADLQSLLARGVYWLERYRFDLAREHFNRALLIQPRLPEAMKWQGVVELNSGDVRSSRLWLERLAQVEGPAGAQATELRQLILLNTELRQTMAEIRYKADTQPLSNDWVEQLKRLLPQEPVGLAAREIYTLMSRNPNAQAFAQRKLAQTQSRAGAQSRYPDSTAQAAKPKLAPEVLAKADKPANVPKPKPAATPTPVDEAPPAVAPDAQPSAPEPNRFEQGQALQQQAEALSNAKQWAQAQTLLEQAVALQPDYPWFRYDLAIALDEQGQTAAAREVMKAGLALNTEPDMVFATALIESRQDRDTQALALLFTVPREAWSLAMSQMETRLSLKERVRSLESLETNKKYRALEQALQQDTRFKAEPEVVAIEQRLLDQRQPGFDVAYDSAVIDGTAGVSRIGSRETAMEVRLPLDYGKQVFFRLDQISVDAGRLADNANPNDSRNLGALATLDDPSLQSLVQGRPALRYTSSLLGVGVRLGDWRLDVGKPVGDFPVEDWVGGVQRRMDIGAGSLRIDLARRMVAGSVLSMAGAQDPVTGTTWGGARRNGITAVHYHPLSPNSDWVGIARYNRITGQNLPTNTEVNLQGILSRNVWRGQTQKVDVGASLFLWQFEQNLRFYTLGQGGYYSPQAFGSFTVPITWTGKTDNWAWQARMSVGASESREKDALRYPGFANVDALVQAQNGTTGGPLTFAGGPGGATSTGLRLQLERRLSSEFSMGVFSQIDRSEGYNPDVFQLFLKWTPLQSAWQRTQGEPLVPYSRF